MKKVLVSIAVGCLAVALAGVAAAGEGGETSLDGDMLIDIVVAPQALVLGPSGVWVTVHADIPYAQVAPGTVSLSGIPATLTKPDTQGNLVAKFRQAAVEAIVAPPQATLVLVGATRDGIAFSGSDTIRVLERGPK